MCVKHCNNERSEPNKQLQLLNEKKQNNIVELKRV